VVEKSRGTVERSSFSQFCTGTEMEMPRPVCVYGYTAHAVFSIFSIDLRPYRHEFTLSQKLGHLADCNFITRLLYKDCY